MGERERLPPRASSHIGDLSWWLREMSGELASDKRVAHHPSEGPLVRKEGVGQVRIRASHGNKCTETLLGRQSNRSGWSRNPERRVYG